MKKTMMATLTTVALATTATVAQPVEAQAQESVQCRDNVALVIPGTSEVERSGTRIGMLQGMVNELIKQAGDDYIIQTVDYPASVGGLIAPIYGANTPFSDSVKEGIDQTINYALEYKDRCPGVKFSMIGYSQGAMIAGDVAEIVGNDKADGLSSDDFTGALLYADPRRARSQIEGQQVQREGSERTIRGLQDIAMEGEGIFGYRNDFGEMTSKTVSFCTTTDIVCNTPLDARPAADWIASLAEYNTGSNLEQLYAFQDIGFGEIQRDVAAATDSIDGSPMTHADEIVSNRIANPASLMSMVSGIAQLAPEIIGQDPAAAVAVAFGAQPVAPQGSNTNEVLRDGLQTESLIPLAESLVLMLATQGHFQYPHLPVSADGTTSFQWGANWLAARMN